MIPTPALSLKEISVRFGTTCALDSVSLELPPGSRVAVVGENGAGKSTLMKVLFGLLSPTAGQLLVNGQPTRFTAPQEAIRAGIGMVQQHFELIGPFTALENIVLGSEPQRRGRLDRMEALRQVTALIEQSGLAVSPTVRVEELSIAAQQRVEILKALYRDARVLILDEPTATLAPAEARELWAATQRLSATGTTLVFITHKLEEVMANADTVLVLRRGKPILTTAVAQTTPAELANAMVGGELPHLSTPPTSPPVASPAAGLVLQELSVAGRGGSDALQDVSLSVAPGEIVGLAGVDGSGQTELIEAIVGLRPVRRGTLHGADQNWTGTAPVHRRAGGLAFIPEDRHRHAVAVGFSLRENAILGRHTERRFATPSGWLAPRAQQAFVAECAQAYDIRGAENPHTPVSTLSGGNQQKLVLARELSRQPRVVVAAQPTRGLDFAATAFVHQSLRLAAAQGAAVLVQSLDLGELLALSDRVAVLFQGRLVGVLPREQATEERLGALMTGASA